MSVSLSVLVAFLGVRTHNSRYFGRVEGSEMTSGGSEARTILRYQIFHTGLGYRVFIGILDNF